MNRLCVLAGDKTNNGRKTVKTEQKKREKKTRVMIIERLEIFL